MTYAAGSTILASDFNTFRTQVNDVISDNFSNSSVESSANFGYGSSGVSGPVGISIISATEWTSLLNRVIAAAQHQGTSVSIPSSVSAGTTIAIIPNLTSSITSIRNNRLNVNAANTTITSGGNRLVSTRTSSWSGTIAHEWDVVFTSYNAARYFFNSGGQIRTSASRSGGASTSQNGTMATLLSGVGTVLFDHTQTTTTGSGVTTSIGFYNLTTSFQTVFQRSAVDGYTGSTLRYNLLARLYNPLGSAADRIRFRAEIVSPPTISGTTRSNVDERRATGPNVNRPAPTYTLLSSL